MPSSFRCHLLYLFCIVSLAFCSCESLGQGSISYNFYDFTSGQAVQKLRDIQPDGNGDRLVNVLLPEPGYPTWSRDGQFMAFSSIDPARPHKISRDVFLYRAQDGNLTKLTAFEDSANANGFLTTFPLYKAFSPNGQQIAVAGYTYVGARSILIRTNDVGQQVGPYEPLSKISSVPGLIILSVNGGVPIEISTGPVGDDLSHPGDGVDWSPTENLLAYPINSPTLFQNATTPVPITAIHLVEPVANAVGQGRVRQITFPGGRISVLFEPFSFAWADDFQPSFSPNGRQIAYVRAYSMVTELGKQPTLPSVRVVNIDGTNDRELVRFQQGDYISHISWSPDGSKLVFDVGAQYIVQGFTYNLVNPSTVELHTIGIDGSGLALLKSAPAAFPTWRPVNSGPIIAPDPPIILGIEPNQADAGSGPITLSIRGRGFTEQSQIEWNGQPIPTTFVSTNELRTTVPPGLLAVAGNVSLTIVNSAGSSSSPSGFSVIQRSGVSEPQIRIQFSNEIIPQIVISWPASQDTFAVESSDSLGPNSVWKAIDSTVTVENNQRILTFAITSKTQFYRLRKR